MPFLTKQGFAEPFVAGMAFRRQPSVQSAQKTGPKSRAHRSNGNLFP